MTPWPHAPKWARDMFPPFTEAIHASIKCNNRFQQME